MRIFDANRVIICTLIYCCDSLLQRQW